jgi:hypothetical protein
MPALKQNEIVQGGEEHHFMKRFLTQNSLLVTGNVRLIPHFQHPF